MNRSRVKSRFRGGFTIVEVLVVIAIIGILATISIVSYGAWRRSVVAATLKSDLNGVIAAMESYRTFNNGYPSAVPSSFTASDGVLLNGGSADAKIYCVEATSSDDASLIFFVASDIKEKGPQEGPCSARGTLPIVPTNLAVASAVGTTVNLTWTGVVVDVVSYNIQCASDAAFILGVQSVTVAHPATNTTISGLSPSNTYYCRIRAVNPTGTSAWSPSVNTTTTNSFGSLAVATSIDGYWTSPPQGFLLEDGAAVSRTAYADLFAVIGTTYGAGNGSTTFNLPDSRGRVTVNRNTSEVEFDVMGEKPGSKTEALTTTQMPSHTHIQNSHQHSVIYPGTRGGTQQSIMSDYNGGGSLSAGAPVVQTNMSAFGSPAYAASTTAVNQSIGGGGTHNNIQPSIVKLSAIKYALPDPAAASLPAGASIQGYWTSAPEGYLLEDGAAVSRATYATLFGIIGTTYGVGNGSTTFNLPDSRGRVAVNKNSADTEFDVIGEKNGAKTHTVTVAQMASHTHTQSAHQHDLIMPGTLGGSQQRIASDFAGGGSLSSGVINSVGGMSAFGNPAYADSTTATNQNTGSDGSHNNIMPSIVKMSAIKHTDASGSSTPITPGTSVQGYWTSTPSGYLVEDGAAVSRTTYADLFARIGTTYGAGNGTTTFNLPDSRGRASVNRSNVDTEFDVMGEKPGSKTEALTIAQTPSHNHTQNSHQHTIVIMGTLGGTQKRIYGDYNGGGSLSSATPTLTGGMSGFASLAYAASNTATNQSTGSGSTHNNIQPSIVKLFVIKF